MAQALHAALGLPTAKDEKIKVNSAHNFTAAPAPTASIHTHHTPTARLLTHRLLALCLSVCLLSWPSLRVWLECCRV